MKIVHDDGTVRQEAGVWVAAGGTALDAEGRRQYWVDVYGQELNPEGTGPRDGGEQLSAAAGIIGHILGHAVLQGADRQYLEQAWAFVRATAEERIDAMLATGNMKSIRKP